MRRVTGAAALGYVVLAAIENMGLLGAPGLDAPAAEVRAAYTDTALGVVTTAAGALSLACYAAFAALVARRWLPVAVAAVALAGASVVLAALLVAGADPALHDVQLQLRYLAGPLMAVFLVGAAAATPRPLQIAAVGVAVPLALTPLALASFELGAQLAFAAHAAWIWAAGLWLAVGGPGLVRRAAFLMLVVAAGLVGVALLAVPEATATFFAWGLQPAATSAQRPYTPSACGRRDGRRSRSWSWPWCCRCPCSRPPSRTSRCSTSTASRPGHGWGCSWPSARRRPRWP